MLIEFSIENFNSIKEKILFSMESSKYKSDSLNNNFEIGTLKLLKSAVIFGPNASGKSNILVAMKRMRDIVEKSADKKITSNPFLFDTEFSKKPTIYEVKFLINDVIYRYGFKLKDENIIEEWLYYKNNKPRTREHQYFERTDQNFNNYGEYKKEADLIKKEDKTREDRLYLAIVAEFNGRISREVMNWFSTFNSFSSIHTDLLPFTLEKIEDDIHRERIVDFMQSADFGIVDIKTKNIDYKKIESLLSEDISIEELADIKKNGANTIESYHHKYNNKKFIGLEPLPFGKESDGTQKLFELTGVILEALDNGEILIIDELDNSFHTKMIEEVVKLFNSEKNTKNAQLIFVSHDTNILTQKIFRRDQIWFVEKDMYGETNLCSLLDFGTRKDTSLEKNYLAGKYGSIPVITNLDYTHG